MDIKLPSYPLITIDPLFSIWANNKILNKDDTAHWTGAVKKVKGYVYINGEKYLFMGCDTLKAIGQKSVCVTPLFTAYSFENELIELSVTFWSPMIMNKLEYLSAPVGYIDYEFKIKNNGTADIAVEIVLDKGLSYHKKGAVLSSIEKHGKISYAKIGKKKQKPLSFAGDSCSNDWGYVLLAANGNLNAAKKFISASVTHEKVSSGKSLFVVAFDDIQSIEYFAEKLQGYWTKFYKSAGALLEYFFVNADAVRSETLAFEKKITDDCQAYGDDYKKLLYASYRQVNAAHKLVCDKDGNLLWLSKECHSNGSINTVDVSYPSSPLFYLYNPALVKAMMTGILKFADMDIWAFDFAPHDIGTYPLAGGQTYGLKHKIYKKANKNKLYVFRQDGSLFSYRSQMPIEECGNMLIMAYCYLLTSGDKAFIKQYYKTFEKWADYLVGKGIVLEEQLCTDDFAGHLEKNVNLAVKSCLGIYSMAKMAELTAGEKDNKYFAVAKANAKTLEETAFDGEKMLLALDNKGTWSLKYNLVWDVLFKSGLFTKGVIENEAAFYRKMKNKYGTPLDNRKTFTKSDWLLWCAALEEGSALIDEFSACAVKFLEDTPDKYPFSDWYDTVSARRIGFSHRTVQGGLWMPVLRDKFDGLLKLK